MSETNGSSLTKSDILNINAALIALETPVSTLVDGKENRQPYDLGEKATYGIIRNLRKLKGQVEDIVAARDAIQNIYNPHKLKHRELPEDKVRQWEAAHNDLMREPAEPVKFHTVDLSEFNVTKNKTLPHSIVGTLLDTIILDNGPQDGVVKDK